MMIALVALAFLAGLWVGIGWLWYRIDSPRMSRRLRLWRAFAFFPLSFLEWRR